MSDAVEFLDLDDLIAAELGADDVTLPPPETRLSSLGRPVGRGGCPHSADENARFLYRWASVGTKVVVVR